MHTINNILIPTDLSKEDLNAMIYGIELTKVTNAKALILHAYQLPALTSERNLTYMEEVEKDIINEVEEKFNYIKRNFFYSDSPAHEFIKKLGMFENLLLDVDEDKKASLIVLGSSGNKRILELSGGHITQVIKKTGCPVLIIPHRAKFKKFPKILLAYDYRYFGNLNILKDLAELFNSEIHILTVYNSTVDLEKEKLSRLILNQTFARVEHSFYRSYQEDMEDAIDHHINEYDIDMIVIIPRHYNLWEKIFSGNLTQKKSFNSTIPLLILKD